MPKIQAKNMTKGFTIMELLIVITVVSVLAASFYTTNLITQLKRGRDTRRKQEISSLTKILEDYYNDKNAYPTVVPRSSGSIDGLGCNSNPTSLQPYLSKIPCDPQYPNHTYLYTVEDSTYQKFRIYTILENPKDPDVLNNPCAPSAKCIINGQKYNYLKTSTNVDLTIPDPPAGSILP